MTDDAAADPGLSVCPWCSASLSPEAVETCPSCGATLHGDVDAPGLTTIDSAAIARSVSSPQRRNRLMSWITGEDVDGDEPVAPGAVAPPPPEVLREMLRMELEAEVAELVAEAGSLAAEARDAGDEQDEEVLEAVAGDAAELQEEIAQEASEREAERPTP